MADDLLTKGMAVTKQLWGERAGGNELPAMKLASSSMIGRSVAGARMVIPQIVRRHAAAPRLRR